MNMDNLFSYNSYFEKDNIEFYKWEKPKEGFMAFPEYDCKFLDFIDEVYTSGLLIGDYVNCLEGLSDEYISVIPAASLDELQAILTYYVRGERFCDGFWATAIDEKIFLKLLKRLREVRE
ncbi:hypothetical protein AB685_15360 [Bacillus sp. LL01]|uniref:DUF6508 domain-containing protein n=1 Tax=Bacillus sp. LL01 TaxID=1665556 RepID=UPI00064D702E|nr:DUF6508 domain-containing protein [Bacillus sp. LL01]KMJ57406.1 hypothetical protein AB685_15360 [Bacillus sp. LL01]